MAEGVLQFNVASMVEEVLQQHGKSLSDIDLASRKAQEASLRRYDAAGWLRKVVGVVAGKDLPAEPSEEDFRLGLRSGIILCNALNKVQPGAVPKVVEAPCDTVLIPDGAPLSAYQYFENVRNFLVAIEEMGIPTFEASDLEKGGQSSRVVNCVLALKSYNEWKQCGGNGAWKFGGSSKAPSAVKQIVRKNTDLFMNFISRNSSAGEKSLDSLSSDENSCDDLLKDLHELSTSHSMHMLVHELLSEKNREDIPLIVERMLGKVMEEFERRLASQNEYIGTTLQDKPVPSSHKTEEIENGRTLQDNVVPSSHKTEEIENGKTLKDNVVPSSNKTEEIEIGINLKDKDVPSSHKTEQIENGKTLQDNVVPCSNKTEEIEIGTTLKDKDVPSSHKTEDIEIGTTLQDKDVPSSHETEEIETPNIMQAQSFSVEDFDCGASDDHFLKHLVFVEHHQRSVQELKNMVQSAKEDMQMLRTKYQEDVNNLGKHLNILAHAASGYKKVLEENRKLYNQVQDLKGNIRVYLRVRPFMPGHPNALSSVEDICENTINLRTPPKFGKGKKSFTFNKVFGPSATQGEVFADTQPLIRSVLDGYNVCIFAYGQTGSGKTHTMTGPKELTKETLGVNYRALNDLFEIQEQRKDTFSYDISVQMMEIYNEQVRDLLATDGFNKKLEIRNNTANGINVPNANLVPVKAPGDVINLMNLGHKNRAVGSTAMNDRSSRSHSCLTVHVQGRDITSGAVLRGCMHLVDLAGSERLDKTEATGDRLKEAQHINKSLSALGDVISSLAQKNAHVPYRNSKLTQLLQDSLGGQAKTLMFVHISPEPDALGETLSTLKFAERVSTIELGAARANKEGTDVKELKEQIATLRAALAEREGGASGPLEHSRCSTPDGQRLRSPGSSPSHSSWNGTGDACKAEGQSNSSSTSRRHSLDLQDLISSPPWPALSSSPGLMEEEKGISPDWVDKVMVNKKANGTSKRQSLDKNSAHRRHSLDNNSATSQYDSDATTSDTSEVDYQWQQLNVPKSNSMPNVVRSKVRRPSPSAKPTKTQETRSQIPQPTKRVSNGSHSPLHKTGRQPAASAVGRQRSTSGK